MKQKITALLAMLLAVTCTACSGETASAPEETKQTNAIVKPIESSVETGAVPKPATEAATEKTTEAPTEALTDAPKETQSQSSDFSANTETRYVINRGGASETVFAYPYFTDAQPDADRINAAIRTHLEDIVLDYTMVGYSKDGNYEKVFEGEWDLTEEPEASESRMLVKVNYTITRLDDEYICILFKGGSGSRAAIQTLRFAEGLVLDAGTMDRYILSDLYTLDAGFVSAVEAGLAATGEQSKLSGDELRTGLENCGKRGYGVGAYMEPEALVILLPGSSILDDWVKVALPYDSIAEYRK